MFEENSDQVAPSLTPTGNGGGLQLKSHEGPKLEGQQKCPHCERMIPEGNRICLQCGFDLKSKKTQQERERKSGGPVKVVLAIAVLAGIAYAGYKYQEPIKNFIEGKTGIELSGNDGDVAPENDLGGGAEAPAVKLDFEIEGDPEELREELELQIEDLKADLEGLTEELADYKAVGKEAKAEFETAKKALATAKKRYEKYKSSSKSKSKIEDAKYTYREAIDAKKEYEAEYKLAVKEYNTIKDQVTKAKKELAATESKLKQLIAYIDQQ